jgi:hypothetical protein
MQTTRTPTSITLTPDRPTIIVAIELETEKPLFIGPFDEVDQLRLARWVESKPDLLRIVAATLEAMGLDVDDLLAESDA